MRRLKSLLTFVGLLGILLLSGCAGSTIPEPRGYVNDFANIISDNTEISLEATLSQYESKTTNEVAVVTVETIGGKSIEDYTISLAEKWGVGKKNKDTGVVILVAEEEREVRIEVGYGLESALTDARAKLIIENEMIPRFKNDDYTGGIEAGVNAVIGTIEGSYSPTYTPSGSPTTESAASLSGWALPLLVIGGSFLFVIFMIGLGILQRRKPQWYKRTGGRNYWYSSNRGFGSSGGGFGRGSFGGGGASGRW